MVGAADNENNSVSFSDTSKIPHEDEIFFSCSVLRLLVSYIEAPSSWSIELITQRLLNNVQRSNYDFPVPTHDCRLQSPLDKQPRNIFTIRGTCGTHAANDAR